MAEGETVFHAGSWLPIKETVKVKALDGDAAAKEEIVKKDGKEKTKESPDGKDTKEGKDPRGGKSRWKGGEALVTCKGAGVCRYFLSESGCKKGHKLLLSARMERCVKAGALLELRLSSTYAVGMSGSG